MAGVKPFICLPDCEATKVEAGETRTGRKLLTVYARPMASPCKAGQWESPPIIEMPVWDTAEQQLLLETLTPGTHVSVMGNPTWVRSRYGTALRVNQARISLLPVPQPLPAARQAESELNRTAAKRLAEFTATGITSDASTDPWAMDISDEPEF